MKAHRTLAAKLLLAVLLCLFVAVSVTAAKYWIAGRQLYRENAGDAVLQARVESIRGQAHYTDINELPSIYRQALLSVEDRRFYSHAGFDFLATCRALFDDVKARKYVEGGSTITQQLAKNLFFSQEKVISRKIAEVITAFRMEQLYSKDELLTLYINSIYYGSGCYNIYDAAECYFGKTPDLLTDAECAVLVGIPNAPSNYSPSADLTLTLQREKQVLHKMVSCKTITQARADEIYADSQAIDYACDTVA